MSAGTGVGFRSVQDPGIEAAHRQLESDYDQACSLVLTGLRGGTGVPLPGAPLGSSTLVLNLHSSGVPGAAPDYQVKVVDGQVYAQSLVDGRWSAFGRLHAPTRNDVGRALKEEVRSCQELASAEATLRAQEPELQRLESMVPRWRKIVPWKSDPERGRDSFQAQVDGTRAQVRALKTQVAESKKKLVAVVLAQVPDPELAALQKRHSDLEGLAGFLGLIRSTASDRSTHEQMAQGNRETVWEHRSPPADLDASEGRDTREVLREALSGQARALQYLAAKNGSSVEAAAGAFNKLAEGVSPALVFAQPSDFTAVNASAPRHAAALENHLREADEDLIATAERLARTIAAS